jgi:hypothetical protein
MLAAALAAPAARAQSPTGFVDPVTAGTRVDFDGDGFSDLAAGVPGEDTIRLFGYAAIDTGAVNTFYGGVEGVRTRDNKSWTQSSLGIPGIVSFGDEAQFGTTVAGGDFDGDGFSDLVVGAPHDTTGTPQSGSITVIYGTDSGLKNDGAVRLSPDTDGVIGVAENFRRFGDALAVGDFDADGFSDLAVGSPGATVSGLARAGMVHVFYGTPTGLGVARNQAFTQDTSGVADSCEAGDEFGEALASGDFNGDGASDLAIGVPDEDVTVGIKTLVTHPDAGVVHVLFGAPGAGLGTAGSRLLREGSGLAGAIAGGDATGSALAAGDLNGDGFADLAVGIPLDEVGTVFEAGSVAIAYGASGGFQATTQLVVQGAGGALGTPETADRFGSALAVGDFDGDPFADLAVGIPLEDVGAAFDGGAVQVFYGASGQLSTLGNQLWTQDSPDVEGGAESGDRFGTAIAAGDFDGSGHDDLVVGVPFEDVGGTDEGAVNILYGTGAGLSAANDQVWHRGVTFVDGLAQNSDKFGLSVRRG